MKICTKCKVEKDESEFFQDKSREDGLEYRCKSCVRKYRHTDAYKEYMKAYRQTDTYEAAQRAYRQKNTSKEKRREIQRAYRLRKKAEAMGNAGQSSGN